MKVDELGFLVVEDDDFQRECLANLLKFLGAGRIFVAVDGRQALQILCATDQGLIDIVLCDLDMPGMDGLEFFRHLGNAHSTISVIISSALDSALISSVKNMAHAYGLTLLGAVSKPILPVKLQELISYHNPARQYPGGNSGSAHSFTLDQILLGIEKKQFEPFFQPKMELASKRIVGAEALARWIHPDCGVISPASFIEQLEESSNIEDLTFIMLERSAVTCRMLQESGHKLTISVNISLTSLTDIFLADKITRIVRENGITPQSIILEITESAAMTKVAAALENLARLRMRGFGLAIDDYGTGYSNMQQIVRVAFSELKIDQSFVKGFYENQASQVVANSSIELAHQLHMLSTAEGIESQRDLDMLKTMGCDLAQGYFIARPMNAASLLKFCAASS